MIHSTVESAAERYDADPKIRIQILHSVVKQITQIFSLHFIGTLERTF